MWINVSRAAMITLCLVAPACAGRQPAAPSLAGTWLGEGAQAGTSFQFFDDGRVRWDLGQAFDLRYRYARQTPFDALDISGFTAGPLAGRTLYCIVALEGAGRLKMDCEPGPPGDDKTRPTAFNPKQTQSFTRARS